MIVKGVTLCKKELLAKTKEKITLNMIRNKNVCKNNGQSFWKNIVNIWKKFSAS